MRNNSKGSAIIMVTILIIIGKLLGFAREVLIADSFGAGVVVDSFLMAESSSTIILGWLASFAIVFTPIYQSLREQGGKETSDNYMNSLIFLVLALGLVSTILFLFFREPIIRLCAPGFTEESLNVTSAFFKIVIWTQTIAGLIGILYAYLNCIGKRVISNLSFVVLGSVQLLSIVAARILNNSMFLAWGLLAANIIQISFLVLISINTGYVISIKRFDLKRIRESIHQVIPVFISTMIADINVFFDKMFASLLGEGIVSVLHYSSRIRILFSYIFSQLLITFFYPDLAAIAAQGSKSKYINNINNVLLTVSCAFIPLTLGCVLLSDQMVLFVYGRNSFDEAQFTMVVNALTIYNISLPALAIRDLFVRVLYVEKKTKVTLYVGIVAVVINVLGNWILMPVLGYMGLALATSISAYSSMVIYYLIVKKQTGFYIHKEFVFETMKISLSSVVMAIVVLGLRKFTEIFTFELSRLSALILLVSAFVIGVSVFVICNYVLKTRTTKAVFQKFQRNT